MTAKQTQSLQNGSAKVGVGRGREGKAEVCTGDQVACTGCGRGILFEVCVPFLSQW